MIETCRLHFPFLLKNYFCFTSAQKLDCQNVFDNSFTLKTAALTLFRSLIRNYKDQLNRSVLNFKSEFRTVLQGMSLTE